MIRNFIFACFFMAVPAVAAPRGIAVLPFVNNSIADHDAMQPLSFGFAGMLSTELARIGSLKLVERAMLDKALHEMALSQSGVFSDSQGLQAGKIAGADFLLLGSYNLGFDGRMRIDARIIAVETGVTVQAAEVTGPKKKLFELVSRLSLKLAKGIAAALTKAEQKSLQQETPGSFEAFVFYSSGVAAESAGDTAKARILYGKAIDAGGPDFLAAKQRRDALGAMR
jgi:TolB-like protein